MSIAVQRNLQTPRICSMMNSSATFIVLKNRLRHDQHVAGLQRNVLLHVAAVEQLVEFYVNDRLLPVYHAHHARAVAGCELTEPTDLKHRIEYRHSLAIGQRLR